MFTLLDTIAKAGYVDCWRKLNPETKNVSAQYKHLYYLYMEQYCFFNTISICIILCTILTRFILPSRVRAATTRA
jgi:hypothetical protein